MKTSLQVRDALLDTLQRDLVGPALDDEVLPSRPSRWYLTGFLVPSGAPEEQRRDPTAQEELSNAQLSNAADDQEVEASPRSNLFPSSCGLSVLVPSGTPSVGAVVRWSDYAQLDAEQTLKWKEKERRRYRKDEPEPEEESDEEKKAGFLWWQLTGRNKRSLELDLSERDVPVPDAPGLWLRVERRPVRRGALAGQADAVSVFLVNRRPTRRQAVDESYIFQVGVELSCAAGFVPRPQRASTQHEDAERADLQFREYVEWAVGHGVATTADAEGVRCSRVATTWLPRAKVHRMAERELDGVDLHMGRLGELEDLAPLRRSVASLAAEYRSWIDERLDAVSGLDQERQRTARRLMTAAKKALERIEDGVAVLEEDSQAHRAFLLANQAMARAARQARPKDEPRWRLFQLAFVLLNLRGCTQPHHEDRESVELLFFPTGGGKTEAYLGVAAYSMFLRRLRGQGRPDGGLGVAVLLRYTLRLLTLDQLSRAARLICAMELVRREKGGLGDQPFAAGLWVGRAATPLTMDEADKVLTRFKESQNARPDDAPLPIETCPWCETAFEKSCFEIRKSEARLRVACANLECPFTRDGSVGELPLAVVDEQIYNELPSFLIATVDKFASLPWRGQVGMLFGKVRGRTPARFVGRHEAGATNMTVLRDGLQPPELVIQDELHLISGPLGTMVGLYEAALEPLSRDAEGRGPKVIASTATAYRAGEQIQALYGRERTCLFPPQGVDDGDTFFAQTDTAAEKTRFYVGVAAPGRSMKATAARVYTCLLGAAQRHWAQDKKTADPYMTLVSYFNSLRDLGGAQRLVLEEVNPRVARLDRRRPIQLDVSPDFANRLMGFEVLELTSRQGTGAIRRAKAKLALPYGKGPNRGGLTDVLLASSMISVGVDIGRLGLMVVNGQPKTVAEYIQASSRVGRSHPGLVVTLLSMYRPRDRSHFERFTAFHESFYRFVEAASVTPFSPRALDRGLAGVSLGLARHLHPKMAAPVSAMHVHKVPALEDELVGLLCKRYLAHKQGLPASATAGLETRIRDLFGEWRNAVTHAQTSGKKLSYSPWERLKQTQAMLHSFVDEPPWPELAAFQAQTSMRDVEPAVHVWVPTPPKEVLGRKEEA